MLTDCTNTTRFRELINGFTQQSFTLSMSGKQQEIPFVLFGKAWLLENLDYEGLCHSLNMRSTDSYLKKTKFYLEGIR